MDKHSNNIRVIACRPQAQNHSWCALLEQQGFQAVELPLMEVADLCQADAKRAIKDIILKLDEFDILIFISQNAVSYAFEWIEDFWPQLPVKQKLFAIGRKTAQCIREKSERAYPEMLDCLDNSLMSASGSMNSEALLELDDLRQVNGKKVLIFKGKAGRTHIKSVLTERGAKVETCELYERSLPEDAINQFPALNIQSDTDVISLFSGETLENLNQVLIANKYENKQKLRLLLPGERVKDQAIKLGFKNIFQAVNASEESMLEALKAATLQNDATLQNSAT